MLRWWALLVRSNILSRAHTTEFAFYVNKNGWRARPRWAIVWEGMPTAFGESYLFVLSVPTSNRGAKD